MNLDVRVLLLMSGLVSLATALCMLGTYLQRKTYPGFMQWTTGFVLVFVGSTLVAARGVIPALFTVVLGNLVYLAGHMFLLAGMLIFAGRKVNVVRDATVLSATAALQAYLTYVQPNIDARIVLVHTVGAAYLLACTVVTLRLRRRFAAINWTLVVGFGASAALIAVRGAYFLLRPAGLSDLMIYPPIYSVITVGVTVASVAVCAGLISLNSQRLELALQRRISEIRTLQGIIPICSYCNSIRDDVGSWSRLEAYVSSHTEARFSHGICPDCRSAVETDLDALEVAPRAAPQATGDPAG